MKRRWQLLAAVALAAAVGPADGRIRPAAAQAGPDPASLAVTLVPYVSGFRNPVALADPGDGTGRLFVVEKAGTIRLIRDGRIVQQPFLDVTARVESAASERGLLGLAFHPEFPDRNEFVVAYTAREPLGRVTYSRFRVSADPDIADPTSERLIVGLPHPRGNHNGGHVAFGPDGYLYLGTGDGGGAGDPDRSGQDPRSLLGKMLRLDIDGGEPYAIPGDNPFVGEPGRRDEIWALGLRNPWRYSFDRETGDLYIADVGQNQREEIDFEPAGDPGGHNYGWNIMEGSACYGAATCDRTGLTLPVAEYEHDLGCSVTGGYVYRGARFPALRGAYLFADYCSNRIWALARDGGGTWRQAVVGQGSGGIQSFGEDSQGELYALTAQGDVLRVVDARAGTPSATPEATPEATETLPPTETATPSPRPTDAATPIATEGAAWRLYVPFSRGGMGGATAPTDAEGWWESVLSFLRLRR